MLVIYGVKQRFIQQYRERRILDRDYGFIIG